MDQTPEVILVLLIGAWAFYTLVKTAVRNGILEADDARVRKARRAEAAAFAKQLALEGPSDTRAAPPDQPS